MKKIFKRKIIRSFILLSVLFFTAAVLLFIFLEYSIYIRIISSAICTIISLILFVFSFPKSLEISDNEMIIKNSFFNFIRIIDLNEVKNVEEMIYRKKQSILNSILSLGFFSWIVKILNYEKVKKTILIELSSGYNLLIFSNRIQDYDKLIYLLKSKTKQVP